MVGNGASTCKSSQAEQPKGGTSVRRQPLKRRSLSQFYVSKSQSFNCMTDLLKESPFSRSSLLLAKRSSSYKQPRSFSSISEEDMTDCTSPHVPRQSNPLLVQAAPLPTASPFASCCLQRHSWDASDNRCSKHAFSYNSLHTSLSADEAQQEQQHEHSSSWQQLQHCLGAQPQPLDDASSFNSNSMMGDEACWCDSSSNTDGLCVALQTASLAAAPSGLLSSIGSSYALQQQLLVAGGAHSNQ